MINNVPLLPYSEQIKNKLNKIIALILEQVSPISIILFGSYARGDFKCTSDLDILVLTEDDVERTIRGDICSTLDSLKSDVVFYTVNDFNASNCYFVRQIRKDGILLWKN